ncbi:Nitrogen permease regulator 3 [Knufia obscura]|uniref:Nitrogen permease regulator 3 n=1 Tax=Knufia obscura TaxID=1635080 RepID=A0ABR0S2Q8_9EURO|nr:Nitrogen permease regulator 3 [Knufia obscura]
MSSTATVPDPCLSAVLLVCQSRSGSGPQLVFHWPPDPLTKSNSSNQERIDTDGDDSSDDSGEWSSEDDYLGESSGNKVDDATTRNEGINFDRITGKLDQRAEGSDPQKKTLFGLDEDGLVGLLSPDRTWNKRKFELSINDLTFVGRPVFAKQDGSWRGQKKVRKLKEQSISPEAEQSTEDDEAVNDTTGGDELDSRENVPITKSELVMFHVVFVMNPSPLDHAHRVKEMYENVIKKFSRALKWVQVHDDYVWQQTEALLTKGQKLLTERGPPQKTVLSELLGSSSLAKALVSVYNAISASKIASVSLIPGVSISMQIPPVTSTAYLPSLTEPPIPPGLWLTTATEAPPDAANADKRTSSSTIQLAKSYTLLLKSPPHRIAKDAQAAGGQLAAHLPRFVAALRPTKSFYKLSHEHQISIADVQLLARHLIYWRRAVAIPPLNQRDTYIVSPNADFSKIREACKSYASQFPASLPSLPKLLSMLSGIPAPFMSLIPSPDHKEIYMLVLAWLMRNGWVTQLRTFAYVRISSDIKRQSKDRERESKASVSQSFNSASEINYVRSGEPNQSQRPSFVSRQSSDGRRSFRNDGHTSGASLIKNPPKATPEESRWLAFLHNSMLDDEGMFADLTGEEREELHHYWPIMSKYFDGVTALESVPIKEGLKRKIAWHLYHKFGLDFDTGVERGDGSNNTMIVAIRHW